MSRRKTQQKRKSNAWISHPEEHRNTQARSGERESMMTFLLSVLNQREKESRLPHLTPERAESLYEDFLKGNLADVQMTWEQMEDYDPTLSTCLHARQSALADMSWRIEPDQAMLTDDSSLEALAAQQTALLTARLRAVDNLEDALVHLGMADFRGVAALEITGNNSHQKWCVIEPWNLVRPLRRGPWFFNKNADPVCPFPEILLEESVIIREARPLDLAAMFLVMSKTHALQGWDGFLDIYGLPSIFAELPPSIPEERRAEFDAVVRRIVGDGRGTVPAGTKFQTVETTKDNAQAFEQRAKWCDDAIIKLVLGGLLTVQAESGSGTLAGNAHADSFDRLCAASARSISRAVDSQFCRRILQAAFPGQPILVHFVFAPQETEDRAANAQLLAVAKQAGWQPDADTASQLLGWDAQPAPEAPPAATGTAPSPFIANRAAAAQDSQIVPSTSYIVNQDAEPLSADELAAINSLANGSLNPNLIAHDAATAASALADAVANSDPEDGECEKHKEGKPCRIHDKQKKQFPKRTEVRTAEQRLNDFRERCKSMSDFEIYKNAKQYLLDDETMQDVIAFKANRKEFERSLAQKLQGKTVVRSPHDPVPHVNFVMRSIEEMSTDHALDRSVRLGCSVAEHKEAAEKADQFIQSAKWTGKRPGGTGKHKDEKNVVAIHSLEHAFMSNSGNKCIAVYTVHEMRDNKFRAYFLYTKRDAEAL